MHRMATTHYSLLTTHCFCTPSPAELVPSPYKQGESAVRAIIPHGLLTTLYSLLTKFTSSLLKSSFSPTNYKYQPQ